MDFKVALEDLLRFSGIDGNGHVLEAIQIIRSVLGRLDSDLGKFCVGFNGGKDCTVLLHMVVLLTWESKMLSDPSQVIALFLKSQDDFEEIVEFVEQIKSRYGITLVTVLSTDTKSALYSFKESSAGSKVQYIFMGSRNADPNSQSSPIKLTDRSWPSFTRVCPILNWSYKDVWRFILALSLPYCKLYDCGYSSIGTKVNTHPNPKLLRSDGGGYMPAWMLEDECDERLYRGD